MNLSHVPASLAAAFVLLTGSANALTLTLDATPSSHDPVTESLDAGTYDITFLSGAYQVATGGAYRGAFTYQIGGGDVMVFDVPTSSVYSNFATAPSVATAFQTGPYNLYKETTAHDASTGTFQSQTTTMEFTVAAGGGTVTFGIPDDNSWGDDSGSITLSLTAVPEPRNLLLVMAGLGAVGLLARRRKSV
jgi:hypothetical protein